MIKVWIYGLLMWFLIPVIILASPFDVKGWIKNDIQLYGKPQHSKVGTWYYNIKEIMFSDSFIEDLM